MYCNSLPLHSICSRVSELTELPNSQLETLGHLMMGSADIRPSLQPEQKQKTPKTLRDFRFEHSFTVPVICPCRRRRRDPISPGSSGRCHGRRRHRCRGSRTGSGSVPRGVKLLLLLLPTPKPTSRDAWRHRPWGFGSVSVPPGYARGHEPRGFGRLNVPLGYARGHGPQRFGRVSVSQGCVGATRAEI